MATQAQAARALINPALRRAYDLRGRIGDTLVAADAYAVGLAFAALAPGTGARRIAVSRDGRLSSPELAAELVGGLVAGGMQVIELPPGPTPLVSFAIHRLGLDGGVMVTGSHNPADQNGFKLQLGGAPLHGAALGQLWEVEPAHRHGGGVEQADVSDAYLDALTAELDGCTVSRAVWDSGNGATGPIVERLAARLGGQQTLFTAMDGRFPHHHPDPAVAANLADLQVVVRAGGGTLGLAFDGDGDRIGVVDGDGAIVWADQLLLLLARDVLAEGPGSAIVADVKSSAVLFDGIRQAGGRAVMGASGYVLVREAMLREGSPLAGEMSGHIFFGDRWHHADDGLYVAVRTLRALARSGVSLRAFRESLPATCATPEVRLACPDARKAAVLAAITAWAEASDASIDRTDGLRVTGPDGWWLLRASGTEPKLTARCEAWSAEGLARLAGALAAALAREGLDGDELLG